MDGLLMDRMDYVALRFSVEQEVQNVLGVSLVDGDAFTDNVMRLLLQFVSGQEVKRQRAVRRFVTFRRKPETTVPGWAYRKPGISSRLPTI
jgi:hypothetical protein